MDNRPTQNKVAAYITQGDRLLVFRHRDAPEAGIQVPGGSIAPGEEPLAAALREAREETDLTELALVATLGRRIHDFAHLGVAALQDRHYYHLRCEQPTPERWLAWETDPSDGSPGPIAFELFWAPLDAVPPLAGELGALLGAIGGREDHSSPLSREVQQMNLLDIVRREAKPEPWAEGDKIPWNDPAFSARMLSEHLVQDHDAASRRTATIERQVQWIHTHVLQGRAGRVLDLGCGPGLYAQRLAALGHTCLGIDFGPASIAYAREQAAAVGADCTYIEGDIRTTPFGPDASYDLAMLIYGELNVFRRADMVAILSRARRALAPGGRILLEPHTFEAVQEVGAGPATWYSSRSGLFSERPHLLLYEPLWREEQAIAIERYFVVDAETGAVTRYASAMHAYNEEGYRRLLAEAGFGEVTFYPSLIGEPDPSQKALLAIVAQP